MKDVRTRRFGTWTLGLILLILGLALLYENLTGIPVPVARYWPFGLVLLGLELLVLQLTGAAEEGGVRIGWAGIVVLIILAAFGAMSVAGGWGWNPALIVPGGVKETFSETRAVEADFSGISKVRLVTEHGSLSALAVPESEVPRITTEVTGEAASETAARALVGGVVVDVECVAGVMTVTVRNETGDGARRVKADLDLLLPADVELEASTRFGNVSVSGLHGPVSVEATYGDVNLRWLAGRARVDCTYGDLTASGLSAGLRFRGTYGDVDCYDVGPEADVETRYGAIDVRNPSGSVSADTTYGMVRVLFDSPPAAGCRARSRYKTVLVEIPRSSEVTVTAVSERSTARTDLSLQVAREGNRSEMSGQLNGGGVAIDIWSDYGGVEVRGR